MAGLGFLGWSALGACSYLYDPDELAAYVPPEAPIPPPDADVLILTTLAAAPGLEEGYGDSGSRPALLVLQGQDISDETAVEIVGQDGEGKDVAVPGLTLGAAQFGKRHDFIAVPVSVAASAALAGNVDVPLTVRISKRNSAGDIISATAPWVLKGRFELDSIGTIMGEGVAKPHIYSKVDVKGALTVRGDAPLVMRSNSTFRITGNFDLSAIGKAAGVAGGATGGDPAKVGAGPSGGSGGGGVGNDGGGAGYATTGSGGATAAPLVGDPQISSFATNLSSGGGGGGILGLLGGAAGGGGGAIELSARGELVVADISSLGGPGAANLLSLGDGGGGAGGTIILRGGTKVTAGNLLATGGRGGDPANTNAGAMGRIRIDTAEVGGGASVPLAVRGAMFDPATPLIVTEKTLPLRIISVPGSRFDLHSFDAAGQSQPGEPALVDFQGAAVVTMSVELRLGYNRLCTTPHESTVSRSESTNCIEVAFIESSAAT